MWQDICEGAWGPIFFMAMVLAGNIAWKRSSPRDRRATAAVAVSATLLVALPAIHWLVVTDRESVTIALKRFETQANARDFKAMLEGIDPDFRSHGGLDKKGLHALLSTLEARHGVRAVQVKRPEVMAPGSDGGYPCEFTMRLTGDFGEFAVVVKTHWRKRDGTWKVDRVVVYRLLDRDQTPLPV